MYLYFGFRLEFKYSSWFPSVKPLQLTQQYNLDTYLVDHIQLLIFFMFRKQKSAQKKNIRKVSKLCTSHV